jgi:hypothetical protein
MLSVIRQTILVHITLPAVVDLERAGTGDFLRLRAAFSQFVRTLSDGFSDELLRPCHDLCRQLIQLEQFEPRILAESVSDAAEDVSSAFKGACGALGCSPEVLKLLRQLERAVAAHG